MAQSETNSTNRKRKSDDNFWVGKDVTKQPSRSVSEAIVAEFRKKYEICAPNFTQCLTITPCSRGETCCTQKTCPESPHFTYIFDTLFSVQRFGLPFSDFTCSILTLLNTTPTQLHPNSWAFMKCFELICDFYGITPTYTIFFYFFEMNTTATTKSNRVSLVTASGRGIFTLFRDNYKYWKK